jgi:hypothetical protein
MSVINLVFDNKLQQRDIVVPLQAPPAEMGDNTTETNQVMIHGVCTPVVSVCGIVFDFHQVLKMTLYDDSRIPYLELIINDDQQLIAGINYPKSDNEIRLQILPPFEDAYKKINLTFYIKNIEVKESKVIISAVYKVPDIYISRLKSFGEINTYNLFKTIASECLLGFASNCEENDADKRFIYCNNMSYESLMEREIKMAGSSENIYDYWIDIWNNINYINLYKRFHETDKEEDMELWCMNAPGNPLESMDVVKPALMEAVITNYPGVSGQLKVDNYNIINNSGKNQEKGTDRVYTIYKDGAIIDSLIEDGNPQNDIFTKYYYLGENIGEYEYLTSISFYDSFSDIVNKNTLEVSLNFPMLGIYRGSHIKFNWYDNNQIQKQYIKELGGDMTTEESDQLDQSEELNETNALILNKQISGEYLVYKTILQYNRGKWKNTLILTRPENKINTYFKNE